MKGKCNCGKKAVVEFMNYHPPKRREKYGWGYSIKFCDDCKPKHETEHFYIIDGKLLEF